MHNCPCTLLQAPSPVLLRSVIPPGFVRHVAELPGKYRNGGTIQPQAGEMGRRKAQEHAVLTPGAGRMIERVDLAGRILDHLDLSHLLQQGHELTEHEVVTVLGLTDGEPEYSYYFVLREFMPLLQQVGQVQVVEDPASEVDPLYHAARARGEDCVFLSFSPPHLTCLGLDCPTIPVFAWEFSNMPDEAWWDDRPEQDWRWCLQQCAGAIVHSGQSAEVVRRMMGADFPVAAIPAPLWDRMAQIGRAHV